MYKNTNIQKYKYTKIQIYKIQKNNIKTQILHLHSFIALSKLLNCLITPPPPLGRLAQPGHEDLPPVTL